MSGDYSKAVPPNQVTYGRDITVGYATLKYSWKRGVLGWALPGFQFTADVEQAVQVANKIHHMIAAQGGLPRNWMNRRATR